MKTNTLDRRHLLRGAGGLVIALPFLEAMRPRKVAAAPSAPRIIFLFLPNGVVRETWTCTGTETNWQLSRQLKPLEAHKKDLIMLHGVDNKVGGGCCHSSGMPALLSGRRYTDTSGSKSTGITLDQHIANSVGTKTRFKSLELAVQIEAYSGSAWHVLSYAGQGQPVVAQDDPYKVFDRVFRDLPSGTGGGAAPDGSLILKLQAQRKASLDYAMEDITSLSGRLGGEDRKRLDEHLTNLRDIERRLAGGPGTAAVPTGCSKPALTPGIDPKAVRNIPVVGRLQTDLMVEALKCDLTRVASFMWSRAGAGRTHPWLPVKQANWHEVSHDSKANVEDLTVIREWYMKELAYLIGKLKSIPDGAGTLFDSTVIVHGSEVSVGEHGQTNMPWMLAGGANGYFKTGRLLTYPAGSQQHPNLLVSLMNAMGVPGMTFGDPAFCKGPLPGLTG